MDKGDGGALLQVLGWLAYPWWFPVPLLALNAVAVWQLGLAADEPQVGTPRARRLLAAPRVGFAIGVLMVTAYVVGGFAHLAWEVGALLLAWLIVPLALIVTTLVGMVRSANDGSGSPPTA